MKRTSLRLASLAMALFTVLSLAHALAEEGYTPYPTPRTAVSEDSTIYPVSYTHLDVYKRQPP